MRHIVNAAFVIGALALVQPAAAQVEAAAVPVDKAPFHVPVFRNEYVALVNVQIPPGRVAGYHIHALDQISVLVGDADTVGQVLGEPPAPARRNPRGNVGFTEYSKKALTHKVSNVGPTPFHNVVITLVYPQPGRFTPGSRADVTGYTQILDNPRVRAWRLVLEPGQSAAAITQNAPGMRVVIDGGEIAEGVPGEAERGMAPKTGEFFWQEPGVTRAVRNTGTTRVQLVEFELK
jgi:hypothetical protein